MVEGKSFDTSPSRGHVDNGLTNMTCKTCVPPLHGNAPGNHVRASLARTVDEFIFWVYRWLLGGITLLDGGKYNTVTYRWRIHDIPISERVHYIWQIKFGNAFLFYFLILLALDLCGEYGTAFLIDEAEHPVGFLVSSKSAQQHGLL